MDMDYIWTATNPKRYKQGERYSVLITPLAPGEVVEIGDLVKVTSTRGGAEFIAPVLAIRAVDNKGTWVVTDNPAWVENSFQADRIASEYTELDNLIEKQKSNRFEEIMLKSGICIFCGEPDDEDCPCYHEEQKIAQERRQKRLQAEEENQMTRECKEWNARADEINQRRNQMRGKIRQNPQLMINAFIEADGDWSFVANTLGLIYPHRWPTSGPIGKEKVGLKPDQDHDEKRDVSETQKLAKKVAPHLLDPDFLENDGRIELDY